MDKKNKRQGLIKILAVILICLNGSILANAQITLTHNVGSTPIKTDMPSCDYEESWARTFTLSDFGISTVDQFLLKKGEVAISNSYTDARLIFSFYSIDVNFPNSTPKEISSGHLVLAPAIGDSPEIVEIVFSTPIVIPAGVERILVIVRQQEDIYNADYKKVLIAGTENDTDVSWFQGCREYYTFTSTEDLITPVPDANFYINVTGEILKSSTYGSTTRLTHNVCDDIIETDIYSCNTSFIYWARSFNLNDFGISTDEEFTITSGQVGVNKVGWLPEVRFNIYKIDSNFPASFSETDLIGSSQFQRLSPAIDRDSQIINVEFDTPIVIPAGVERILVEVHKGIIYGDGLAFIAGSTQDNDVSWQRGCIRGGPYDEYVSTADFGHPDANFYINVTGNSRNPAIPFNMEITNICAEFLKEFSVANPANMASVQWNFGDPSSGANNLSNDPSPTHDFSGDGRYTVTATITDISSNVYVVEEQIDVVEPPNAYAISNIYACEDVLGSGISSSFNTVNIESQVLGGQTDKVITYYDGTGNELAIPLAAQLTNSIKDRETITVRVAHKNNLCCISETSFDLIVQALPEANSVDDLYSCDNTNTGFANFDLTTLNTEILNGQSGMTVSYFNQSGVLIPNADLSNYTNSIINKETITARVTNTITKCYNEIKLDIIIENPPLANSLTELTGCDDNNDGISEFFDTSNVESEVLGGQTGLIVSYFNSSGAQVNLDNPYTNTSVNSEVLTVRVTNPTTTCFSETDLTLRTSSKPQINQPQDIYGCDLGNGFASFDLSSIENEVIGSQTGLTIYFYDENGVQLNNSQINSYQNKTPYLETIKIKVENQLNNSCFSEVDFKLHINELPIIELEENYFLCDLEPYLALRLPSGYETYQWIFQDGTIVSSVENANLVEDGSYTVTVSKLENGIQCENTFSFKLVRSNLPQIDEVLTGNFGSNFIEVIVSGDGDFEYSIDGVNYQDEYRFDNVFGGNYLVFVRDKNGCGFDSKEISIIDYPKFFSPNNDGINDTWSLLGDTNQNYKLYIFNRFGKLMKELNQQNNSWDGLYNGILAPQNTYWFKVIFEDGTGRNGSFALRLE